MTQWIPSRTENEMVQDATTLFQAHFGEKPQGVWAAPGRVNLIGEHVDYAGGVSIPFALEQNTAVAVSPRTDGLLSMVTDRGEDLSRIDVELDKVGPHNPDNWAGYVAGAVWAAVEDGVVPSCSGLSVAVTSDVPVGSGLSSSAAIECSTAVAAYELATGKAPDEKARKRLVKTCMRAENEVVGASTGGLDQNASLLGQRGKALVLDFSTGELELVPFNLEERGMVLLIADTNAPHSLSDGQYASRRGVIDDVQEALGGSKGATLRDIPQAVDAAVTWAEENGRDVEMVRNRVVHVVEETQRTLEAANVLKEGNLDRFAELMRDSHISLRDQYEVTTAELDSAFDAAGQLGARMTGGGFGGAVIVLTKKEKVDATVEAIRSAAADKGFPEPTFLVALPGQGARRLA